MAYAALVSLEQTIHRILNHDRHPTSPQQKHHMISLDKHVISFQAFLDDFPDEAKLLEPQIRDATTAAEDVIECFMLDQIQLCYGIHIWIDALMGMKFEYKLNKVEEKMEAIAAEVVEIKDSVVVKYTKLGDCSIVSSSTSEVVGLEDDLMEIKGRLVGDSPKLQYLSISGMGGIGKTTLARNAYEDKLVQEHFDVRAWVTISQVYRAQETLSRLLDSMKKLEEKESNESIEIRVYKILCGRRYLIVMDDIWSTEVLEDVRKVFPDDGNRSRIMLTTRISDVAAYDDPSPHQMRLMDEEKSWDLLKHKISRDILSDGLEMIGHEIARSCRGLPLAVVVIAGILSCISETPDSWEEVAKNIKKATSKDGRMEEIVSLGYNHLPHRLRPCLLYMGLLPEDYNIRVSLLIKLWISEGFLKHPDDPSKSLEADAEEHLEDLVQRNLILVTERKYNGKIKTCSLHDMVRDACIRFLEEEKYLRHVTTEDNQGCISKRSVLRFGFDDIKRPYNRFKLLRVLHVPNFEYNSSKMLELYHLRHLCFYRHEWLPTDMSNFHNLQSLIIGSNVPSSIWKLRQLRHLILKGFLPAPDATSALESLQTLKQVVIDIHETNLAYLLQRVPNLIKLGILFWPYFEDRCLNESLAFLCQLEELKISFLAGQGNTKHFNPVFPCSLKKLTLVWGRASVSFLEAVASLPNLQVLKLRHCVFEKPTWEVRGGEFPNLKMLQLYQLYKLTTFIVEDSSTAFPMLNCILINRCFHLVELSDEIGDIPTLQLIQVSLCGIGVCDWAERVEESQQDLGNDTLQVNINYSS